MIIIVKHNYQLWHTAHCCCKQTMTGKHKTTINSVLIIPPRWYHHVTWLTFIVRPIWMMMMQLSVISMPANWTISFSIVEKAFRLLHGLVDLLKTNNLRTEFTNNIVRWREWSEFISFILNIIPSFNSILMNLQTHKLTILSV